MPTQIINQLETALSETVALLNSFNEQELNTVPFEGSWTAAQVGRHLYKAETGTDQLLYAPTEPAGRQPDERADELKNILLNYSEKLNCPDFLIPESNHYDKQQLIDSLSEIKDIVLEAATNADLTQLAPLPNGHPLKGSTKLEIVHFITYHAIRHNHQLNKIKEVVQ